MPLDAYLNRIGLEGPLPPTLDTLKAVHQAQSRAVPYEGLDIQLGVPLDLNPDRIFDKLVTRKRGGWCYETNGLLAWALDQLGFAVTRCAAGVYRREKGDAALGNHLTLIVALDGEWLCDLGLGDALRTPIPLTEGPHSAPPFDFRLERLPDGYWRFHNHAHGSPTSFDFRAVPADEGLFHRQNIFLQTDSASHFVLNAEAVSMRADHALALLGKVLCHSSENGLRKEVLATPEAWQTALIDHFGIEGVDVARIWPRIEARHRELFGA